MIRMDTQVAGGRLWYQRTHAVKRVCRPPPASGLTQGPNTVFALVTGQRGQA